MRHIAMARSMNKVIIRGITHIDWRVPLMQWDKDDPKEVDLSVMRSVRKLMMEKKVCRAKAWILIAQLQDGRWVGYYRSGIRNKPHKKHALEWLEGLYHLIYDFTCYTAGLRVKVSMTSYVVGLTSKWPVRQEGPCHTRQRWEGHVSEPSGSGASVVRS
jgi:hypothetical protein